MNLKQNTLGYITLAMLLILAGYVSYVGHTGLEARQTLNASVAPIEEVHAETFKNSVSGTASWYGYESCTNPKCLMANGEPLDLTENTVAFWDAPLGTIVLVRNQATGEGVYAEVTDTGNFHKYGRVIDLNQTVKDLLGCGDLCAVTVEW